MRIASWAIGVAGMIGVIYALTMDTTVAIPASGELELPRRVHNIGLLEDRRTALIISSLAIVVGVIGEGFSFLARLQHVNQFHKDIGKSTENASIDPDDWQNQRVELNSKRAAWGSIAGRKSHDR